MSTNHWQPQNNRQDPTEPAMPPRKSGLLSNYREQTAQQASSVPPANSPAPQGPPSFSPFPPASSLPTNQPIAGPQGGMGYPPMRPSEQNAPAFPQAWNGPAFMARPLQMVQQISSKMAALRRPVPPVDPNPLVLYHSPQPFQATGGRSLQEQPTPWRRSRVQRINHLKKRRRERAMRGGPGSRRLRTIVLSSIAALLLISLGSTAAYAYNFYQSELPQVQNLANANIPQSTHIYDRHGTLLYTLYAKTEWGLGGRSTPISYSYLPGVLQDAQIAAEDPTFWTNDGIDPQGILRAFSQAASNGGHAQSGGSTMTQQLIKNLSGNNQDTIQRKASEAALAIGLTQQYPKWKIMEMYFNVTPYGAQEKGIEAAIEDYFGLKPVCTASFKCTPAVAFLDRDLTKCSNAKDERTCKSNPMLALARAVLLAGIPQNPTHFDPSVSSANFQNVLGNRVPYVIEQMIKDNMDIHLGLGANADDPKADIGPITPAMEPQIENMISKMHIVGFHQKEIAPHFVNWVIDTLSCALGNGDCNAGFTILENSGLNVYTTLDLPLEQYVESDVKHNLRDRVYQEFTGHTGPLTTEYNLNDAAAVAMDAKTGEVLAMDGSVDYSDTQDPRVAGNDNVAISNLRQPGSSFKPIVYAAAFEKGWYPGIRIIDNKTYFPNGGNPYAPASTNTYQPTDYGNLYHKVDETARINLANSFNVPAVKAQMYAGFDSVVTMARRLGITDLDTDLADYNRTHNAHNTLSQFYGPSLALGTAGVSLLQMTDAYQTFADNGVHVPTHNVLDIWDDYGHNLYHYDPTHPNGAQVLSPEISFMINSMLSDNPARDKYEFSGTDTLTMGPWAPTRPVAAKTGTTNGPLDNWTMGYTSNVVVGVWSGNADGGDVMVNNPIGIVGAAPIWHDIITYLSGASAYSGYNGPQYSDIVYPTAPFTPPSDMVYTPLNSYNGLAGSGLSDWVLQNEVPTQNGLPPCLTNTNPGPGPGGNGNGHGHGNSPVPTPCPPTGNPGGNQSGNSDINGNGDGNPFWPGDPFGN